ncbi:MAG TPA: ester cyclase [Anaerolineaceae bacterium]|nr:ester cyclase [Anaerolineaceae bacterium]
MSSEHTRALMNRYWNESQPLAEVMAPDVVFTIMSTGNEYHGIEAVERMLNYFYREAFRASSQTRNTVIEGNFAVLEADFTGEHVGEFAGVPGTGRTVQVPICVVYELRDGKIWRGRVYLHMARLLEQIGAEDGEQ